MLLLTGVRISVFSIGEFSRISGLTVKTLRFYHEEGLLIPSVVDRQSSYRYYDAQQLEVARVITWLREMELPIAEIRQILKQDDDAEILDVLERQKLAIQKRIAKDRKVLKSIDQFISEERQATAMATGSEFVVEEKTLAPMFVAGVRMKGHYSECGKSFGRICRSFGRYAAGKPMMLHYDTEYKEADADFEACVPLRAEVSKKVDGVSVHQIPGGKCVTLLHKGPYEQLSHSYSRILQYVKEKGYRIASPSREVYLKGPGMIFRGNPKNYLTEIQMLVES